MARSSTVAKLSRTALLALIAFCEANNCGVMLRLGGVEDGYTADDLRDLLAHDWKGYCIRKGWESPIHMLSWGLTPSPIVSDWRLRRELSQVKATWPDELFQSLLADPLTPIFYGVYH